MVGGYPPEHGFYLRPCTQARDAKLPLRRSEPAAGSEGKRYCFVMVSRSSIEGRACHIARRQLLRCSILGLGFRSRVQLRWSKWQLEPSGHLKLPDMKQVPMRELLLTRHLLQRPRRASDPPPSTNPRGPCLMGLQSIGPLPTL